MCHQRGTAKLNQLMHALGPSKGPRPNSESSAKAAAQVIKQEWIKDPQKLNSINLEQSFNELCLLVQMEKEHPKETKIARAIVDGLCENPPVELAENAEFMLIRQELANAVGKTLEDFQ